MTTPDTPAEPVIEVKGLVSRFGEHVVHDRLDLTVNRGEIFGVVGGSGAGKSVLLNTLIGLRSPDAGEVRVFGTDPRGPPSEELDTLRSRWGVLFQSGALFSALNVRENVGAPLREHAQLPLQRVDELADLKIRLTGLNAAVGDLRPAELSGGMRKRAGLARALSMDPELLFLDEPTAGLDPIGAEQFDALIRNLSDSLGLTVFMITHDLDSLYALCDRVAVIADKKVAAIGPIADLERSEHPWVREYFLGPRGRAAAQGAASSGLRDGSWLMERNAHYALVGLISLILTIALVLFVIWLARLQFTREYDVYDVDFRGPVRGLSAGGEVYFNGIRVGEVTKLSLDARDPNRVMARVRVTSDAPVRVDSYASLEPLGITGVNYIQITAGTRTRPLLKDVVRSGVPVIATRRGSLESLLEGGGTVLARAVDALDRVNRMLSDRNLATISTTLSDVQSVTAELKSRREILANLDSTIRKADDAAERVAKLSESADELVNGDARRALASLADAAEELKGAAQDGRAMVDKLQGPTTEFATSGLPQVSATMIQLQVATESLNRVISDIETNPSRLISKPAAKTIEVKP